jgi:hypothetical protein
MRKKLFAAFLFVVLAPGLTFSQLKVNAYFSAQYIDGKDESDFPHGTFQNVRGGVLFSGQAEKLFSYALEVRLKTETNVEVEQAWAGIRPSNAVQFRIGFYLVPFGKYNQANRPHETPFIQTPLHLAALYPASWRDIGLLAEGRSGFLSYSLYMGNGLQEGQDLRSGQQFKDNNTNKGTGGQFGVHLSQSFEVGLSYYRGKYDNANTRKLVLEGAHAIWQSESFLFVYEYGRALLDNPEGYSRGEVEGYYALVSLNSRGFMPFGSYQSLDYRDPFHGPGFSDEGIPGAGIFSKTNRWAVGLTYLISANIAIGIEYDFNRETDLELDNDVFVAQLAVHF